MPRVPMQQPQVNNPQLEDEDLEEINQLAQSQQPMQPQQRQVLHQARQQPEQKQQKESWGVGQIAKETEDVIVNAETGEAYRVIDAVALLLNKVDKLLKNF